MRIAVICSAGGSSFFSAYDIAAKAANYDSNNFVVITDRECGAEEEAVRRKIQIIRISYRDKIDFSKLVAEKLYQVGVDQVLLYYSRIISHHLYNAVPTYNIHPSSLPAFKGMNAVDQAINFGVTFIGATLHEVNENIDNGRIIAQTNAPIPSYLSRDEIQRLSFLQKTYLTLVYLDYISIYGYRDIYKWKQNGNYNNFANPSIISKALTTGFYEYKNELNFPWGFE